MAPSMHHTRQAPQRLGLSLRRYLWRWAFGAVLALWSLLATLAYFTGYDESEEISDGLLVSVAQLVLQQPFDSVASSAGLEDAQGNGAARPGATDVLTDTGYAHPSSVYSPALHVLLWQGDRVVWDSHGVMAKWPMQLSLGHQTVQLSLNGHTQDWRVYVAESAPRTPSQVVHAAEVRRVAVFVDQPSRQALAEDLAEHIALPALLFLPVLALLLAWAMRRGLRPLERLSGKIAALNVDAGQTLTSQQPYQELEVTVQAINTLVQRLQNQIGRERRFAADVAHELRTPLTSLVLQARLARDAAGQAERAAALQVVEQQAMRSGRILSQLLDLARAESLPQQPEQQVDLCALAHQVVSEHAPLAHHLGQDIALEAPSVALLVPGNATLLALAVRNLVDNALRHNPPGTFVEVRVGQDVLGQPFMAVSDDGLPPVGADQGLAAEASGSASAADASKQGLGIGLSLVVRIAQSQSIQWVQGQASAPFVKRSALVWPVAAATKVWH
jgi:two-component system sensor histidine kinase QseC